MAAINFVRSTGGNDGNSGVDFANGWATLEKAYDTVAAGEELRICSTAGSPFTISAPVDIDTTSGTVANPITVRGGDLTDGSPYNGAGQAYIVTTSSIASLFDIESGMSYYNHFDIYFDGGGSGKATHCIETSTANEFHAWVWKNCRFTNADTDGLDLYLRSGGMKPWTFVNCEIDNNGKGGVTGIGICFNDTTSRCWFNMFGCNIHDNLGHGARLGVDDRDSYVSFVGNNIYDNGGSGIYVLGDGQMAFQNNVFYGNTASGLLINGSDEALFPAFLNNIFSTNGAYAIDTNAQDDRFIMADYNCYYNNTSGSIDTGSIQGNNNITADPKFVSVVDGSEDFRLQGDSPCIDVGFGYDG